MSHYLNVSIMSGTLLFDAVNVFKDLQKLGYLLIESDIIDKLRKGLIDDRRNALNASMPPCDVNIRIPIELEEAPKGFERAEIKDILEKHHCVSLLKGVSRVMEEKIITNVHQISDLRRHDIIDRMRKKYGRKL